MATPELIYARLKLTTMMNELSNLDGEIVMPSSFIFLQNNNHSTLKHRKNNVITKTYTEMNTKNFIITDELITVYIE